MPAVLIYLTVTQNDHKLTKHFTFTNYLIVIIFVWPPYTQEDLRHIINSITQVRKQTKPKVTQQTSGPVGSTIHVIAGVTSWTVRALILPCTQIQDGAAAERLCT